MPNNQTSRTWLERIASWRFLAILVVLYGVVFTFLMRGMGGAPGDNQPLDLMFSYSPEQVYTNLAQLGEVGRKTRILVSSTLDTAYPLVYSMLFAVLITLLTRFLGWTHKVWKWLALLPFVILAFDLSENLSINVMAFRYPERMAALAQAASLFTSLKWIFVDLVLGALAILALLSVFRLLRRQGRGA